MTPRTAAAGLRDARLPRLPSVSGADMLAVADALPDSDPLKGRVTALLADPAPQVAAGVCLEAASWCGRGTGATAPAAATAAELLFRTSPSCAGVVSRSVADGAGEALAGHGEVFEPVLASAWVRGKAFAIATLAGPAAPSVFARGAREACRGDLLEAEDVFNVERSPARCMEAITGHSGSVFALAAELGGLLAGLDPPEVEALATYGRELGFVLRASADIAAFAQDHGRAPDAQARDVSRGVYSLPVVYAIGIDPTLAAVLPHAAIDDDARAHVVATVVECGALDRALADCAEHGGAARRALRGAAPVATSDGPLAALVDYAVDRARPVTQP